MFDYLVMALQRELCSFVDLGQTVGAFTASNFFLFTLKRYRVCIGGN
jgi:hypothetical protein